MDRSPKLRPSAAFSLIEMVTVVAILAILVGAAVPTAASLFARQREELLRENLTVLRMAIREFRTNAIDDDRDGRLDEDPRGDANHDGFPGLRGVDDDGDLLADEDWGSRVPFATTGRPDLAWDGRMRSDDDEDGAIDEEAFPGELHELAAKVPMLRKEVPLDPTSGQAAWTTVLLRMNNDVDYTPRRSGDFRPGIDPVVQATAAELDSVEAIYQATTSKVLFAGLPPVNLSEGTELTPLADEDPRNGLDDDGDGRIDEDAPDMVEVRSANDMESSNGTPYASW